MTRSARLVAAALVGALRFVDPGLDATHRVAVDGSLYGGYPGYDALVRRGMEELVGSDRAERIAIEFTKDSTGLGAAVIAASASADRLPPARGQGQGWRHRALVGHPPPHPGRGGRPLTW